MSARGLASTLVAVVTATGAVIAFSTPPGPARAGYLGRAAFPGRNGRIAFAMHVRQGADIFTINPDGTGLHRLTRSHDAIFPAWAPGGRRILYSRYSGVWVMRGNGQHKIRLVPSADFGGEYPTYPSWSPDSRRFAFCAAGGLWTYTFATGSTRKLASRRCDHAAWSPRGSRIVFTVTRQVGYTDRNDLWVIAPDGTGLRQITKSGRVGDPAWAPHGLRLLTADGYPGDYRSSPVAHNLTIRRLDGSVIRRIPVHGDNDPAWSPDGRWIATARWITRDEGSTYLPAPGLWLMHPNGTDPHRLFVSTRAKNNSVLYVDWRRLPAN